MEKPWMDTLMDALQPPVTGEASSSQEPAPEEPTVRTQQQDTPPSENASFADIFDTRRAPSTRVPLEYEGSPYWNESWSDRVLAHAPTITVILLFLVGLAALSFFYRVEVGHSLIRFGEKISGDNAQESAISSRNANAPTVQPPSPPLPSETSPPPRPASSPDQAAANTSLPAGSPEGASKNLAESRKRDSNAEASSTSRDSLPQSAAQTLASESSTGTDDGQAEFRLAHTSLSDARTPEARARAADLLWTAVSKGSSDAEIELADLYGRGDGVRRNCQQARILLAAARDQHNPLAEKETSELRVYGCR